MYRKATLHYVLFEYVVFSLHVCVCVYIDLTCDGKCMFLNHVSSTIKLMKRKVLSTNLID